jgi:hypothetical protein
MQMSEFIKENIDPKKAYTMAEATNLFTKFVELNGSRNGMTFKDSISFRDALSDGVLFADDFYDKMSDDDMLKIIKEKLSPFFGEYDFKNKEAPLGSHSYIGIQSAILRTSRLGKPKCFEYLLDNVAIEYYDIDMLCVLAAIKFTNKNNEKVLNLLVDKTSDNYCDGAKGAAMLDRIKHEVNLDENITKLGQMAQETIDKVRNKFKWIKFKTLEKNVNNISQDNTDWANMSVGELKKFYDNDFNDLDDEDRQLEFLTIYKEKLSEEIDSLRHDR